jgi:DNA adenine methylase
MTSASRIVNRIANSGEARASSTTATRFAGAKGGAGVWQRIINQIPPHSRFVEAFAGTAQVLRHKLPASSTIAIDSDAAVCAELRRTLAAGVTVIRGDALAWLGLEKHRGEFDRRTVVYCDPPYLFKVRRHRRYYRHEFGEEWLHGELLAVLSRLTTQGVCCLISGYRSELYDRMLPAWRRVDYQTTTRGGPVVESLWCNFPEPAELHDYRWLGLNFRERERIKRKKSRWLARLRAMGLLEKAAVLAAIDEWRQACIAVPDDAHRRERRS